MMIYVVSNRRGCLCVPIPRRQCWWIYRVFHKDLKISVTYISNCTSDVAINRGSYVIGRFGPPGKAVVILSAAHWRCIQESNKISSWNRQVFMKLLYIVFRKWEYSDLLNGNTHHPIEFRPDKFLVLRKGWVPLCLLVGISLKEDEFPINVQWMIKVRWSKVIIVQRVS